MQVKSLRQFSRRGYLQRGWILGQCLLELGWVCGCSLHMSTDWAVLFNHEQAHIFLSRFVESVVLVRNWSQGWLYLVRCAFKSVPSRLSVHFVLPWCSLQIPLAVVKVHNWAFKGYLYYSELIIDMGWSLFKDCCVQCTEHSSGLPQHYNKVFLE